VLPEIKSNYLVNARRLKTAKLWPGSLEEQEFNHGGLTVASVRARITKLERCDDLTTDERTYLALLRDCLSFWPEAGFVNKEER
jgi:hypothetical protein